MLKRILVALDPDTDTPVATRYAIDIARRYDAEVTGLAIVDMSSIKADARGGGIGSMYLREKVQENLTAEARSAADDLTSQFEQTVRDSGVRFHVQVEEGAPFERIIEDVKYHDLLVVGKEPHFFYSHPEKETDTLVRVVRETIAPTLVVPGHHHEVRRVLVAYDGSGSAARSLQRFVHLQPFGTDLTVELYHVRDRDEQDGADQDLHLARDYMNVHGFNAEATSEAGSDPAKHIIDYAQRFEADLVVAGAHSVSRLTRLAFGSTTAALLKHSPVPLFIDH